jgi:hypothetical protein
MLAPEPRPGLHVRPPLPWGQYAKRHLVQALPLADNRAPVAGAEDIAAEANRIADKLAIRWIRQGRCKRGVHEPPAEACG